MTLQEKSSYISCCLEHPRPHCCPATGCAERSPRVPLWDRPSRRRSEILGPSPRTSRCWYPAVVHCHCKTRWSLGTWRKGQKKFFDVFASQRLRIGWTTRCKKIGRLFFWMSWHLWRDVRLCWTTCHVVPTVFSFQAADWRATTRLPASYSISWSHWRVTSWYSNMTGLFDHGKNPVANWCYPPPKFQLKQRKAQLNPTIEVQKRP